MCTDNKTNPHSAKGCECDCCEKHRVGARLSARRAKADPIRAEHKRRLQRERYARLAPEDRRRAAARSRARAKAKRESDPAYQKRKAERAERSELAKRRRHKQRGCSCETCERKRAATRTRIREKYRNDPDYRAYQRGWQVANREKTRRYERRHANKKKRQRLDEIQNNPALRAIADRVHKED